MQPTIDNYPVFEANQVLTNAHLNQVFDYLDEQNRLTRANLIGIGIVCGLDVSLDNPAAPTEIRLDKGCGITSAGYLIVELSDVTLTSYHSYALPADVDYPAFQDVDLWELFPDGEPETVPLTAPPGFLIDKAVVLFLELKKEALRNCSPNNCDDKGAKITATVRRLLISKNHLDAVIAAADPLAPEMLDPGLSLNLPDVKLPRYNAPASPLATSHQVLAAFLEAISNKKLAAAIGSALTAAYEAFRPIVEPLYPDNPFAVFPAQFGFLDTAPVNTDQVRFLPYYYNFFSDVVEAYDEVKERGTALMCACSPPSGLFPRHLMLGLLFPSGEFQAQGYRHTFMASPAVGKCESRSVDVLLLFRRLVEMVTRLIPAPPANAAEALPIRITPSRLGASWLSNKAIPYYYLMNGSPPLYRLWNPERTRRLKPNHNLGYRADEYVPAAPNFVTSPLAYDLEPYNFLRIEGHVGKPYQTVIKTVLDLKRQFHLPIDVIALRTGAFDENISIDVDAESCHFNDLESLYAAARSQTLCLLVKVMTFFYNLGLQFESDVKKPIASQFAFVDQFAPGFLVQPNTLGRRFEDFISARDGIVPEAEARVIARWIDRFTPQDSLVYYSLFFIVKVIDALPNTLSDVRFATLDIRFNNLDIVVSAIKNERRQGRNNLEGSAAVLDWDEIGDRLDDLLHLCQADVFKSIRKVYEKRIRELKKKQFLGHFLQGHPGIQHKAGVPIGGTLLIVYHQDAAPQRPFVPFNLDIIGAAVDPFANGILLSEHTGPVNVGDFFINAVPLNIAVRPDRLENAESMSPAAGSPGVTEAALRTADLTASAARAGLVRPARPDVDLADAARSPAGAIPTNINQNALIGAIRRLQEDSPTDNPDIRLILDNLNILLPNFPLIPFPPGTFNFSQPAERIIAAAVEGLADGTVITDFYLPYLCCSDCPPIQYVAPKAPPSFRVDVGCTIVGDETAAATVTITARDGTPPYQIKIDDGDFQALDETLLLSVGSHRLTVQDADGIGSSPQTVTVAEALRVDQPQFTCSSDGRTYVAILTIAGGTPPYSVNGTAISGTSFTSQPVASGAALTVRIDDQRKCMLETSFTHTCPPPCDLPNGGLSQRCAYRLWLQPAVSDERFEAYRQASTVKFRFNGRDLELEDSDNLLQIDADALNTNFTNALSGGIKRLNEAVNKAIVAAFGSLSRPRLSIDFEPRSDDPFGIFRIEHFIGDTFSLEFDYRLAHSLASGDFTVRYSNEADVTGAAFAGASFVNLGQDNRLTRVPAFACSRRNQCTNSDFAALCEGFDLVPAMIFRRGRLQNSFTFSLAEGMPTTGIAAWVWEFTTSTDQPFYVGDRVNVIWNNVGGFVKLTAISDKGCFSMTLQDQR